MSKEDVDKKEQDSLYAQPPESVTINEIAFMHQILQACASRGAFKPDEFTDVGALNNKLKALMDYARKLEEAGKKKSDEDVKSDE